MNTVRYGNVSQRFTLAHHSSKYGYGVALNNLFSLDHKDRSDK